MEETLVGVVAKEGLGGEQTRSCAFVESLTLPTRELDRVVWLRSLHWVGWSWEEGSQRARWKRMAVKAFVVLCW